MERSGAELTRAMLLNSHSRGSLQEVAGDDDPVETPGLAEAGQQQEQADENAAVYSQWEGRDLTRQLFLESYD